MIMGGSGANGDWGTWMDSGWWGEWRRRGSGADGNNGGEAGAEGRVCESAKTWGPAEVTSLGDLPEFCLTY